MPTTVGKGVHRRTHPVVEFTASVRQAFADVYQGPPLTGPLLASMLFVFPRPASMRWKRRPMVREWLDHKPDSDNLAKAVLDSLNGIAYVDDGQVHLEGVYRVIAAGDEQPGAFIQLWPAGRPPAFA